MSSTSGSDAVKNAKIAVAADFEFIKVSKAVIPAAKKGTHSLLMLELENTSIAPDMLYDARIEPAISKSVQTHLVSDTDGMIPVPGIPIYPKSKQKLPGQSPNYHVMIISLLNDLTPGMMVNVTLNFELMGSLLIENVTVS